MNTKTMEGLVGARTNINLVNTPLRVYKEARRKGDTATMERAMGYVNEFEDKAEKYKAEADEGMKEDAREASEKTELDREKAIEKRKEEREKLEERVEERRETRGDKVEISEGGKALLEDNTDPDLTASAENRTDTADNVMELVIYTKTGKVSQTGEGTSLSISI